MLFRTGEFTLASGLETIFKIDCDFLSDADMATLAYLGAVLIGRPFSRVLGVPEGGQRFAENLEHYAYKEAIHPTVVVDDVWTTGKSMNDFIERNKLDPEKIIRLVIFSRGNRPYGVKALFSMPRKSGPEEVWL